MWQWFDGKKMIIGTICFMAAWGCQHLLVDIWQLWPDIMPKIIATLNELGVAFGGVGGIHKIVKKVQNGK